MRVSSSENGGTPSALDGLKGNIPSFEMDDDWWYPHDYGNPHRFLFFCGWSPCLMMNSMFYLYIYIQVVWLKSMFDDEIPLKYVKAVQATGRLMTPSNKSYINIAKTCWIQAMYIYVYIYIPILYPNHIVIYAYYWWLIQPNTEQQSSTSVKVPSDINRKSPYFSWVNQLQMAMFNSFFACLPEGTRWCTQVISWFIIPINYRYIPHKP